MCPFLDPNDDFHKLDAPILYNLEGNSISIYRNANSDHITIYVGSKVF